MVAPCDKYQGLVVGPDGQTAADPYGLIATVGDYEEWRTVADVLIRRAEDELARENAVRGSIEPNAAATVLGLRQQWDDMGGWVAQSFQQMNFSWGPSIVAMVELAKNGACEFGIIEARIIEAGGTGAVVPTVPARTKGGGKAVGKAGGKGIGLVVMLGAAAWYFGRDK
jgi:hypothetical protein